MSDPLAGRPSSGGPGAQESEGIESAIPDHIRERYIQVRRRFHFPDGDLAFHVREMRTTTRSENPQVIRDILEIERVRAQEGQQLRIRGTAAFRAEAWMQAQLMGLDVSGYRPSDLERARLAGSIAQQGRQTPGTTAGRTVERPQREESTLNSTRQSEPGSAELDQGPPDEGRTFRGRLVSHGAANYQHDRHEPMSYYIKLITRDGEKVLWGRDLERAIKESLSNVKIGDEVSVQHAGDKLVSIEARRLDMARRITDRKESRNDGGRWIIENREFLRERRAVARVVRNAAIPPEEAVERHPTLVGTYVELHAAKLVAQEAFKHEEDRERFVARVRNALADEIARGEALTVLRLKGADTRAQTQDSLQRQPRAHVREHVRA